MKHGTVTGYRSHRCRCDECRAAHAASARAYRDANWEAVRAAEVRRERGRKPVDNRDPVKRRRWQREYHARNREARIASVAAWRERNRPYVDGQKASWRRRQTAITSASAARSGERWSETDDEMVQRGDLACREIAVLLGRTYKAVVARRRLLRSPDYVAPRRMMTTEEWLQKQLAAAPPLTRQQVEDVAGILGLRVRG